MDGTINPKGGNTGSDGAPRPEDLLPEAGVAQARRVRWRRWVIGGLVTAGVLSYIFHARVKVGDLLDVIKQVDLRWIPLAIVLVITTRFIMSVKWWLLLKARDVKVPLISLSLLQFTSYFIGRAFPGALGMDLVRTYVLAKEQRNTGLIVASVLMDRITNMVALALVSLAALSLLNVTVAWKEVLMLAAGAVCVGFVVMLLLSRPIDAWLARWEVGSHSRFRRALDALRRGAASFNRYNTRPLVLLHAILWGLLVQAVRCMEVYVLFVALGHPEVLFPCFALIPLVVFALMVPLGVSAVAVGAGAMVVLFDMVGVPSSVSFTVAILADAVGLVLFPFGALCYWLRGTPMLGMRPGASAAPDSAPGIADAEEASRGSESS
jgi:uncharacterized protein (TIRG00374 family)